MIRPLVFAATSGLLSPWVGLGSLMMGERVLRHGFRTGMSATTYGPLFTRYLLHELGEREDDAAARVMRALPSTSGVGLRLVTEPIRLASRLSGYHPPVLRYDHHGRASLRAQLPLRTHFIDRALTGHVDDVAQVVILGAGFDTRAYGVLADRDITVFEIDTPATQPHKIAALERAGIPHEHVRFVTASFRDESAERPDWLRALLDAGFDPSRPTFFLWEGVTYYLHEDVVRDTLRHLAQHAAPGSYLAIDYFTELLLRGRYPEGRSLVLFLRAVGEPLRFGLRDAEAPTASRFLEAEGWSLARHEKTGAYGGLILAGV